ncbi:phosphopantetheine-binding protein [Tardiphaga sp.]|jgi:acyl carrier protein|uniref:phosphopantetheine-binding protein n=1 Tax=Tardiphaga sp. TaxID=1926292 RepID=UPI0037DA6552
MTSLDLQSFAKAVADGVRRQRKAPSMTVDVGQSFGALGLDSLDVMNMVLEVESTLGINFGEIDIGEDDTTETFLAKASAKVASV